MNTLVVDPNSVIINERCERMSDSNIAYFSYTAGSKSTPDKLLLNFDFNVPELNNLAPEDVISIEADKEAVIAFFNFILHPEMKLPSIKKRTQLKAKAEYRMEDDDGNGFSVKVGKSGYDFGDQDVYDYEFEVDGYWLGEKETKHKFKIQVADVYGKDISFPGTGLRAENTVLPGTPYTAIPGSPVVYPTSDLGLNAEEFAKISATYEKEMDEAKDDDSSDTKKRKSH